jgi:hypothetical protein
MKIILGLNELLILLWKIPTVSSAPEFVGFGIQQQTNSLFFSQIKFSCGKCATYDDVTRIFRNSR